MYQCQCAICGGIFIAENKRSSSHETIADCIETFRGRIATLETELSRYQDACSGLNPAGIKGLVEAVREWKAGVDANYLAYDIMEQKIVNALAAVKKEGRG